MQIRQRVSGREIVIDAGTLSVRANGRILTNFDADRIIEEAKKTVGNPLVKMINILNKKEEERKH